MRFLSSVSYNKDVAKIVGVIPAILLSLLDSSAADLIAQDAYDGRVLMSRDEIYNKTGIPASDQITAESILSNISILSVADARNSVRKIYTVDEKQLREVLNAGVSIVSISKPSQPAQEKPARKKRDPVAFLKQLADFGDDGVNKMLGDWIAALYEIGKGGISKQSFLLQQQMLKEHTLGDPERAKQILTIAITRGYRDISWAIKANSTAQDKAGSYNFSNYTDIASSGNSQTTGEVF